MQKTKYKITRYMADPTVCFVDTQDEAPTLDQLQKIVGGLIEAVPEAYLEQDWFIDEHKDEIVDVYCHEEALLIAEPKVNRFFRPAPWGDRLYGNVVVVEKLS